MHPSAASAPREPFFVVVDEPGRLSLAVIVSPTHFKILQASHPEIEQAIAEINSGSRMKIALPGRSIPIPDILEVAANERDSILLIEYESDSFGRWLRKEQRKIRFSNSAKRNQVFDALQSTLGQRVLFKRTAYGLFRAVIEPVVAVLLVILIAYAACAIIDDPNDPGLTTHDWKSVFFKGLILGVARLFGKAGARTLVIGCAVVGLYVAGSYLGRRLKNPPIMLSLRRGPKKSRARG